MTMIPRRSSSSRSNAADTPISDTANNPSIVNRFSQSFGSWATSPVSWQSRKLWAGFALWLVACVIAGRVIAQTTGPSAVVVGTLSKTTIIEGETTMGNLSLAVNNPPVGNQECTLNQKWSWSVSVTTPTGTAVPATSLEATLSPTTASTTNLTVKGKSPGIYKVNVSGNTNWESNCEDRRKSAGNSKTITVTVNPAPRNWTTPVDIKITSAVAGAAPPRATPVPTPEPDPNADPTPSPSPTPAPSATPVPTPVEGTSITTNVGQNIKLTAVLATTGDDTDTWKKTLGDGSQTTGTEADGPVEVKWKINGTHIASGLNAWWMARNPGTYTLTCEADDKWKSAETGVTSPDTGTRNDPVVTKTVTITAVANPDDPDLGTDPGTPPGSGGGDGCNGRWVHADVENIAHWKGGARVIPAPPGGIPYFVVDPQLEEYRKYEGNCPPETPQGYFVVNPTRTDLPSSYNASADRWYRNARFYAQAYNFSDRSHDYDVTLSAPLPYKWTTPSPISGGEPVKVNIEAAPNASVDVAVSTATDKDTRTVVFQGSSTLVDDNLTYTWTSSDGRASSAAFPQGTSGASVKYAAPSEPGSYTLTCKIDDTWTATNKGFSDPDTGSRDDTALTKTITVVVPPKEWDIATAISGGRMKAPQDQRVSPATPAELKVVPLGSLPLEVEGASDSDHWKQADTQGNESDSITYEWSATGGTVTPHPTDPLKASWSAPNEEGTFTLKCTIKDGGQVSSPDIGTRNDDDVVRSVSVQVVAKAWDVGLPIGKNRVPQPTGTPKVVDDGRMLLPQDQTGTVSGWKEVAVEPLQTVDVAVEGVTDLDHWTQLSEGEEADETSTKWTCDKGTFQKKNADDEWEDVGQELTGTVGRWRAPKGDGVETTAKLTCTMDDKPKEIVAPDEGTRDDEALEREVTIRVVPRIWEVFKPIGQKKNADGTWSEDGQMAAPQNQRETPARPAQVKVKPGGSLPCNLYVATDWDKWTQNLPAPTPTPDPSASPTPTPVPGASPSPTPSTRSGEERDEVTYTWTCSDGYFLGSGGAHVQSVQARQTKWYAPTPTPTPEATPTPEPGASPSPSPSPSPTPDPNATPVPLPTATITCTVDDKPLPVVLPDGLNADARNDGNQLVRTVTVTIDPNATDADHSDDSGDDNTSNDVKITVNSSDEDDASKGWVVVNEGYDEGNTNYEGNGVWDNYPDAAVGHRINPSDEELTNGTLSLSGSGRGRWSLDFPTNIKIWRQNSNGTYVQVQSNTQSAEIDLPYTLPLKIEGIRASSENGVGIIAELTRSSDGSVGTGRIDLTVIDGQVETELVEGNEDDSEDEAGGATTGQGFSGQSIASSYNASTVSGSSTSAGTSAATTSTSGSVLFNFPPLMSYSSSAIRMLTAKGLPQKLHGKTVRWQVNGPGLIANSGTGPFVQDIIRPVDNLGRSSVMFRTSGHGGINIALRNPSNYVPVLPRKYTVAFKVTKMTESDHQMNRIWNDKAENSHNYSEAEGGAAERAKLGNTLFYTQEPENDRVELALYTTFLNSSGKNISWRFAGEELNADLSSKGYWEYRRKFLSNSQGVAYVQFLPRAIAGTPGFTDYASGTYTLSMGGDTNGDGVPDYWMFPARSAGVNYRLRHVSINEAGSGINRINNAYLLGAVDWFKDIPLTKQFLRVFLNGPAASSVEHTVPTPLTKQLSVNVSSLTHIAGAHFSTPSGNAAVPVYPWGQSVSEYVYKTSTFKRYVADSINKAANRSEIQTRFRAGGSNEQVFEFDLGGSLDFAANKGRSAEDFDCWAALGGVGIFNGTTKPVIRIRIEKQADNVLKVKSFMIVGYLEDLNDYDYYGASATTTKLGVTIKEPVSRVGASVQIAWEGTARPEGAIFFNRIDVGKAFASGDGYGIVEYVSQNAVENITF